MKIQENKKYLSRKLGSRIKRISILTLCIIQICSVSYAAPSSYSNFEYIANIENQEDNACVAYAVANAIETQMKIEGYEVPKEGFDKKWFYNRAKELDGHDGHGTFIDIALEIAKTEGIKEKSGNLRYKIGDYKEIEPTSDNIKEAMYNGYIVVASTGIEGNNWYNSKGNILPTTSKVKENHAIYFTGFNNDILTDNHKGYFEGVNSWGKSWGNKGKFKMSYTYAEEKLVDAWIFDIKINEIQVDINSDNVAVDDRVVFINQPNREVNETQRVLVPLVYLLDSLGYTVNWNEAEQKLTIKDSFIMNK